MSNIKIKNLHPDPTIHPICFICLSFNYPNLELKQSTKTIDLFVLMNENEYFNCLDDQVDGDKHDRIRSVLHHGLTNYGLMRNGQTYRIRQKHIEPQFIWCPSEWSLLNWVIYLVQRLVYFDNSKFEFIYFNWDSLFILIECYLIILCVLKKQNYF